MGNRYTARGSQVRRKVVSVRYSDAEHAAVTQAAKAKGRDVSEHIREKSLKDDGPKER